MCHLVPSCVFLCLPSATTPTTATTALVVLGTTTLLHTHPWVTSRDLQLYQGATLVTTVLAGSVQKTVVVWRCTIAASLSGGSSGWTKRYVCPLLFFDHY